MSRKEFTAGEEMTADKLNKAIIAGSYNAGETVAGATLPVPAYQDTSDNEFYACDANDATKLEFVGFIISDGNDGDAIDIQFNGIVKGFSGLDEGEKYYVQDVAGTIGKTVGTYKVLAGIAISETELLIIENTVLEYVEIALASWSRVSSTSTWENWDLSSIIPIGAKYAEVIIYLNGSAYVGGARKNGSALDRKIAPAGADMGYTMLVELDTNRIIERYGSHKTVGTVDFTVSGYWK